MPGAVIDAQRKTSDSKSNAICFARYSTGLLFTVIPDNTKQNSDKAIPSQDAVPMANHDNMFKKNRKSINAPRGVFADPTRAEGGGDNRSCSHILFPSFYLVTHH
ncbi:hypothetical protein EDWATA_02602 [Edwardsiella tarda ATCC 23685]|uniref:Uncharacterized protein n=1 Tax=Edwardsiella tarda ATCC 23685 TaxID=500638 RepID=D4F768_EDWTA|nr:hypothetical protein EDWATA_02602 [Edwardsiella tarda ATCC 23685]